jgi:two-component system sensor histidine kinase MtrB
VSFDPATAPPYLPPSPTRDDTAPPDIEVSATGEVEGVPIAAVAALADETVEAVAAGAIGAAAPDQLVGRVRRRTDDTPWWRPGWARVPLQLWRRSLPLRVVSTTFVASIVVLLLGGAVLMQAASQGVVGTKERSAQGVATTAIQSAQAALNAAALTPQTNVNELLYQLTSASSSQGNNGELYDVILRGPVANYTGRFGGATSASIPAELRTSVLANPDGIYSRSTTVVYPTQDGSSPMTVPGYVVGSTLRVGAGVSQIYFVFPLDQEVSTLKTLQGAVITAGALLIVLLTLIAAVVSRQVVSPVRAARLAAERLASGNLEDRMQVKGTDDFASLAISMNYMATELQKQINQLEELSRVQQRFVSDVSHELRTPLTTVRMAAEVLYESREEFDPIASRSTELLQTELDRFESLLTDLLEISRFDAGAAVLTTARIDLVEVTHHVVEAHAQYARSQHVEVRVHAEEPAVVEADSRRIERILRNLLVNAIEHSERHPVDIYVAANDLAAAVAVRDHGVGFQADQAKQVFHRFWRADPARARTIGGSGLGLSISMEDARLHGGWIVAWGRPGMGAQFRLTLPREAGTVWTESPLPLVPRDFVGAEPGTDEPGAAGSRESGAPVHLDAGENR